MDTAQEILNRIRWDAGFAAGASFEIGYYDRVQHTILKVKFKDIRFPEDNHFSFEITDDYEDIHTIPYHRVKEIYRNGRLIWHREH
ncbi:MAG: DUF504 domain-containing protein [Gammaproteobacteria bacterium]|jgi:uncharacterized protein (UPF0248 family)